MRRLMRVYPPKDPEKERARRERWNATRRARRARGESREENRRSDTEFLNIIREAMGSTPLSRRKRDKTE